VHWTPTGDEPMERWIDGYYSYLFLELIKTWIKL